MICRSFSVSQIKYTGCHHTSGHCQNHCIDPVFPENTLSVTNTIRSQHKHRRNHQCRHTDPATGTKIIPHPCKNKQENNHQNICVTVCRLCEGIKNHPSQWQKHQDQNQRSRCIEGNFYPFFLLASPQYKEKLHGKENSQRRAKQYRIFIIICHSFILPVSKRLQVFQICGKRANEQALIIGNIIMRKTRF